MYVCMYVVCASAARALHRICLVRLIFRMHSFLLVCTSTPSHHTCIDAVWLAKDKLPIAAP